MDGLAVLRLFYSREFDSILWSLEMTSKNTLYACYILQKKNKSLQKAKVTHIPRKLLQMF